MLTFLSRSWFQGIPDLGLRLKVTVARHEHEVEEMTAWETAGFPPASDTSDPCGTMIADVRRGAHLVLAGAERDHIALEIGRVPPLTKLPVTPLDGPDDMYVDATPRGAAEDGPQLLE
jgi:hypothetical protein